MTHNFTTFHRFPKNTAFHSGENRFVYVAENPEHAEIKKADGLTARLAILAILAGCFGVGVVGRDCGTSKPQPVTVLPQPTVMKNVDNVSRYQQTAINTDGVTNGDNIERIQSMGINFPKWMYDKSDTKSPYKNDIDSFLICLDGAGCDNFEKFRQRAKDMFQPKEAACTNETPDLCEQIRERNTIVMLSFSAIGAYQILLWHHGKNLDGWKTVDEKDWKNTDWKNNLVVMFNLLNNVDAQKDFADKVIKGYLTKNKGKVFDAASEYYSGHVQGIVSYTIQSIKRGVKKIGGILRIGSGKKSSYAKYKLPREYARGILKCFKEKTGGKKVADDTQEHLDIMRKCIHGKETGGADNKFEGRESSKYDELIIRWKNRGVELDSELEKRWRAIGSQPDTTGASSKTDLHDAIKSGKIKVD